MKHFILLLLIISTGCNQTNKKSKQIITQGQPTLAHSFTCNYQQAKARCRVLLSQKNNSKMAAFFSDSLLPCWYGTPWDFNGCTQTPGEGKIACGYFITTTLQDAGVPIKRIKMAQCPSSQLIRTVCSDIQTYSNKSIDHYVSEVKKKGNGLYIAGLDYHTGFIYYDGNEVYFIHASFYGSRCVVKEKALASAVLQNSKLKMIGKVNFE